MTTPRKPTAKRAAAMRKASRTSGPYSWKLHPEAACAFQRQFGKIENVVPRITYSHLWLAFTAGVLWQRRQRSRP